MTINEDVYDPLERYRDEYRETFVRNAEEKFEELLRQSKVDEEENRRLMSQRHALGLLLQKAQARQAWAELGIGLCGLAILALVIYLFREKPEGGLMALCIAGGVTAIVPLFWLFPCVERNTAISEDLQKQIEEIIQKAQEQMAPLNRLYDWDIPQRLMEKTVPRLEFDPVFTQRRLEDLRRTFGWSDDFNEGKSVLCAQSGVIHENPFVFGKLLVMRWGTQGYHGSLTIHWTERERGADGKMHTVRKSETLTASVTKPCPKYSTESVLIFGNDAAPNLSFSREPSPLSNDHGLLHSFRMECELDKLKDFSRNLEDDSQYTLMSNEEFEVLFHAVDRNDEVEFRMLYTPVAQQQTLLLLKDGGNVGFGDEYHIRKQRKITVVQTKHLNQLDLDTSPDRFRDFDLERARKNFLEWNQEYFRVVYFALASLLAVPLYQQTRTAKAIYKELAGFPASFWEDEALANARGEKFFAHSDSCTENILKTRRVGKANSAEGVSTVEVTAHGFRTVRHVEYVGRWGGDGRMHDVPVEWLEYLPVQKVTTLGVSEQPGSTRQNYRSNPQWLQKFFRKGMVSFFR